MPTPLDKIERDLDLMRQDRYRSVPDVQQSVKDIRDTASAILAELDALPELADVNADEILQGISALRERLRGMVQ